MIDLILGGQYGSEGKGSVASWMSKVTEYDATIRTGGTNAGHTFIPLFKKEPVKMRQLPCTWDSCKMMVVPSGAVIDIELFLKEVEMIEEGYHNNPHIVCVSPYATVVTPEDRQLENQWQMNQRIGSTAEGIGSARSRRLMRQTPIASDFGALEPWIKNWDKAKLVISNPNSRILIESSQGFALSLHYKHYPKCTSGDLMPYQILQDANIPWGLHQVHVHMICRTFPIRVAGASGYLYEETSWEKLRIQLGNHIPEERTTVTNKVRRVGMFDFKLMRDALEVCCPQRVILTFADYLAPELFNMYGTMAHQELLRYSKPLYTLISAMGCNVDALGTGIGTFVYLRDCQRDMGKAEAEYFEFLKSLPEQIQMELLKEG